MTNTFTPTRAAKAASLGKWRRGLSAARKSPSEFRKWWNKDGSCECAICDQAKVEHAHRCHIGSPCQICPLYDDPAVLCAQEFDAIARSLITPSALSRTILVSLVHLMLNRVAQLPVQQRTAG